MGGGALRVTFTAKNPKKKKNPSLVRPSWSGRESVELSLCSSQIQPPEGASGLGDGGSLLGALGGAGSADRVTARTNEDHRWKQMRGSAG